MNHLSKEFDLFCLDFDGLLVDSEKVHMRAYQQVLIDLGFAYELDFLEYCSYAHHPTGDRLRHFFFSFNQGIDDKLWKEIVEKKQKAYSHLLETEPLALMPGAKMVIERLLDEGKALCVVTNSRKAHTLPYRSAFPVLDKISLWITRDDVEKTKPHPDGYLKALSHFTQISATKTLGLDDALKGITAIRNADITPLLVCDEKHPQLLLIDEKIPHLDSLVHFFD